MHGVRAVAVELLLMVGAGEWPTPSARRVIVTTVDSHRLSTRHCLQQVHGCCYAAYLDDPRDVLFALVVRNAFLSEVRLRTILEDVHPLLFVFMRPVVCELDPVELP